MAATSSSMASSSQSFDVFLSFRGKDTRHSFTDHLYTALKRAALHTFRDDDGIKRGQYLEPEIVEAIENSRASVVVLSENYAKSRWCLGELSLILEQKKKGNHFILPVFYKVDPSDVRNQQQNFAIEGSKWIEEDVNRWKSALREVGRLAGMVASGSESEFIAKIVDTVHYELNLKLISTPAHLTGMETRAEDINSWLKDEHPDTNVLAICGMGGSGKTTLAQYIYNSNKHNFESSSFLEDIGKHFRQTNGLLELQKQLLSNILDPTYGKMIYCVSEGANKIKEILQMKKVLIVLDDIDENDELGALVGTNVIHTQSRIIITTRLLDIHSWFESRSWKCCVHELKLLNNDESLEVLSCHAFGSKVPLEGFRDLAVELAQYCGGNPLALKVLGSSLFVSIDDPRERNNIIESWRSRLNSLSSLKGDLDCNIQCVLRKSFDTLPLPSCKELFLHIVVFFVGEDEEYVVKILEHDWHAKVGIRILKNRCLLTISPNKKLVMHQLLQDMGRIIIREESRDPAKRSRVWCSDEACRVLTKGDGSDTIEGLTLDMRKLKKWTKPLTVKIGSIANMDKLKLLQLKYVKLNGYYNNFPELRWLCLHGYNLKRIRTGLLKSNFLVTIDMTNRNFRKFKPPMVLNSLKILNLTSCKKLLSIHKLNWLPNLETLILWNCGRLRRVCETLGGLESLALLNLAGCKKFWKSLENQKNVNQPGRLKALCTGGGIPKQPLFALPQSLKFLFLDHCNLEYHSDLRVVFSGPLFGVSLHGNPFEFIPMNIELKMLRVLNLTCCINLKSIMCLPSTLEELYTYNCKSLEKVTFQSARFTLRKFGYKGCLNLTEVQGLFKLVAIEELGEADLGHMKWIKAHQYNEVDLVGDEMFNSRVCRIQMLYEYGIRSIYLQSILEQSMITDDEYTSSRPFISFRVSSHPNKHRIQGLNVSCLYRASRFKEDCKGRLYTLIINRTKGVAWMYNPLVYCKPRVEKYAMWSSYWPIGYMLDVGDEIHVVIIVDGGMKVNKCGASLVYMDAGEVEQQEMLDNNSTMKNEEVIGGDLSEFQLNTGLYYLCRRDFFKSSTPDVIKRWFGDNIHYTDLQGWRKSYESQYLGASCMHLEYIPELHRDALHKIICLGYFNKESDKCKIKEAVYGLEGVYFVKFYKCMGHKNEKILYVMGGVDYMAVETCVREFEKTVRIIDVAYKVRPPPNAYQKILCGTLTTCTKSIKKLWSSMCFLLNSQKYTSLSNKEAEGSGENEGDD